MSKYSFDIKLISVAVITIMLNQFSGTSWLNLLLAIVIQPLMYIINILYDVGGGEEKTDEC